MASKAKKPAGRSRAKAAPVETVLVMRTCDSKMRAHGDFVWPTSGPVSCSDWSAEPVCGGGLHGLLWGEGDGTLLSWDEAAKWLVVEVAAKDVVKIDAAKVKFPRGVVIYCGDSHGATKLIAARAPKEVRAIVMGTSTSGYGGTSTSGDRGTSTSGYGGTSTSGDGGTSTSGYGGTSTSGDGGTSTSGDGGTSTSGYRGTSTSGEVGILVVRWYDTRANRYRLTVGYVGESNIKPNTPYRANDRGELVEVTK